MFWLLALAGPIPPSQIPQSIAFLFAVFPFSLFRLPHYTQYMDPDSCSSHHAR